MWGTDGVRVFTADEGWVWTFAAVDHWNAECVGWHVCKVGSRFAALEPVAQGLRRLYGSVEADVARGLALRMDHGSQYLSDHFLNQLRYWGIHPSFGLLEEPETNGVVERWNRTLKEQAVYGRVFRNLAEVRAAVAGFVERYNRCWRLEKLAYRTPLEAREEHELRQAAQRKRVSKKPGAVHVHGFVRFALSRCLWLAMGRTKPRAPAGPNRRPRVRKGSVASPRQSPTWHTRWLGSRAAHLQSAADPARHRPGESPPWRQESFSQYSDADRTPPAQD